MARGHDVLLACASECPVQVRAASAEVPVLSMNPAASATNSTMQIRRTLKEREFDVVFVHTDRELLMASSAVRLGRGGARVIRRVPPFAPMSEGRRARMATRIAPTGLLFSTETDLASAQGQAHRLPATVAPLAVDVTEHDAAQPTGAELAAPPNATFIVCVHDGVDPRMALVPLRTLSLLAGRHPELHLIMLGARQEELQMEGAALGINARVTYLGARDDELSVLRRAHVGWVAAEGDAAAFATLDFMAFGVPVIAERAPLTEHFIVDGSTGLLLPRADLPPEVNRTAASIAAFLARKEQRAAMGRAARTRLDREFSYEAMIRGFEAAAGAAIARTPETVA